MEDTFILAQGLFARSLGVIYLIAFLSLLVQARGLYGAKGITPIQNTLEEIRSYYGSRSFFRFPIIFWLSATDSFILGCISAGAIASVFAVIGIYPAFFLFITWFIYYSLCVVGHPFLSFQWDILLLETGFIGLFFVMISPPPLLLVIALWVLLFRLMFLSGITKYVWGSKDWRDFSALKFHYETQPLPTRMGYYMHQLPHWFGKFSVLVVYFFELLVPFFIFSPAELRVPVFFLLVFFQFLILLTGNYTFFNLLTIVLCIPLIPDSYLGWIGQWVAIQPVFPSNIFFETILDSVGALYILASVLSLLGMFYRIGKLNVPLEFLKRYHVLNSYGLFVHMTTKREEIILEGSMDGKSWTEYEFKWKPGDIKGAPGWVAPHQPRLDWQTWFVPLSYFEQNPWLENLIFCLLNGVPEVVALLQKNPFPESPPKYIRVLRYRYHFTDLKTKRETGAWWRREYLGHYGPNVSYSLK